jgi:hypothetical protein
MKITPVFAWYDLWIGLFWDRRRRCLYLLPLPMIGIRIQLTPRGSASEAAESSTTPVNARSQAAGRGASAMTLRLGDKATDVVSGCSGILVARVEYLAQETEYLLLLRPEEGKTPDSYYVAEKRLMASSVKELQELKGEL